MHTAMPLPLLSNQKRFEKQNRRTFLYSHKIGNVRLFLTFYGNKTVQGTADIHSASINVTVSRAEKFAKTDKSDVTFPIGMTSTERFGFSVCA